MAATSKKKNLILKFWDYTVNRLERTVFLGLKFTLPKKYLSPMGYSGMLTFALFLLLYLDYNRKTDLLISVSIKKDIFTK